MKVFRDPPTIAAPLAGYTHQAEVSGPVRWLVLSGQVGMSPAGELPPDPVEQLRLALANIAANLDAAGMDKADLVKLTLYFAGPVDVQRRREVLGDWLGGLRPTMTVLTVAGLATPDLLVEVEALACADEEA